MIVYSSGAQLHHRHLQALTFIIITLQVIGINHILISSSEMTPL